MIINDKIVVKNYKCFDSTGGGFDRIMPINVIIGKNNSGKSSLIELVDFVIGSLDSNLSTIKNNKTPEVIINHTLTESEVSSVFKKGTWSSFDSGGDDYSYGLRYVGINYIYQIDNQRSNKYYSIDKEFDTKARPNFYQLANSIKKPFEGKQLFIITAERDIVPEIYNGNGLTFKSNGIGISQYLHQLTNRSENDRSLIEQKLLSALSEIINPDITFLRILVQQNNNDLWEIYFEDVNSNIIALSKMGSGIKTILLVLLNLIVIPTIQKKKESDFVYAFEELENNLHPSIQRRLYNYIKEHSEKYSVYFFLTTHSNIVIDTFGTYENAQIIHVFNNGSKATTTTISSNDGLNNILNDLDIKASDLLQSNGIIWVEGPSDRIYINKWLGLLSPELIEGSHYSIMFYGGRLLANLAFDYESFNEHIIPLLRINRNSFVIMDRDGKGVNSKLNATKIRVKEEIGNGKFWITRGREIENYLSNNTLIKWLNSKNLKINSFDNEINTKIEDSILKVTSKIKYNESKTKYSTEIVKYIENDDLNNLDLKNQMENLISKILKWNS